jgi:carboxypeptidase C (cathepsin A)
MKIKFPRNVIIDTDNIPQNFEDLIRASFEAYTEETAKDYTYQDKLAYIDKCRMYLHRAENTSDCVLALMKDYLEYEVTEQGEIPDKEDYLSVEFMENCYENGRTNLYDHYTGNHHVDDKIMGLLARAIKVVINYETR